VRFFGPVALHNRRLRRAENRSFYYDRNGDGRVDQEKHHFRGLADADWELRDDDYNGRYEKKILYGFALTECGIDVPVPTHAPIEPKP
jgi:hypothetical protein